ncbi:MAG TPA: ATP-binding protein [Anaerolineae bacterium]|nr:ATP-binding protein [Anaerolineae bacterium]
MGAIHSELQKTLGVSDPTLYRWRAGTQHPRPEQVAQLVTLGVTEAHLAYAWAKETLREGGYPELPLLAHLFPNTSLVHHKLSGHLFPEFIGRAAELVHLEQLLQAAHRRFPLLVEGPAGCGKSALVRELAWRIVAPTHEPQPPPYTAIIWVAVPAPTLLTQAMVAPLLPPLQMPDIYHTITTHLSPADLSGETARSLPKQALTVLQQAGRVLLCLDGVENLHPIEWQPWLQTLPATTQVILTSRTHLDLPYPVILTAMPPADAYALAQAEGHAANLLLTPAQLETLANQTYGHPYAIRWAISQIAMRGVNLPTALQVVAAPQAPFQQFLFAAHAAHLRVDAPDAYRTWGALAAFPLVAGASLVELAACLGLSIDETRLNTQLLVNTHLAYFWPDRQGCSLYPWGYPSAARAAAESRHLQENSI